MSLRSLLFTSEDGDKKKEVKGDATASFQGKFPSSNDTSTPEVTNAFGSNKSVSSPSFTPSAISPDNPSCEPHLDKIMGMYEKGFDDLNQDGYDFYEFFKSIIGAGVNNTALYPMALTMAKGMDSSVSKDSLINQSNFYITEIKKVHTHYETQGNKKNQDTIRLKDSEESALKSEVESIEAELNRLSSLKIQKEKELSSIDAKYTPQITEIGCKLMANNMAKDRILGSINSVVNGIKNNI